MGANWPERPKSLAQAVLLAAALGLPSLGQQIALQARRNAPGEDLKLRVPQRRPKRGVTPRMFRTDGYKPTAEDVLAMAAAQMRRERRARRPQGVCA